MNIQRQRNRSLEVRCLTRSNEETVGNHNYCILEKSIQSIRDHADHYNTAEEPKEDNLETDHHNSINDTEEPYQSVKDDYDYTSNAVRTGPDTRKPDAIYNKLKLDRPGDYDHVAGLGYNMSQPGSDYDTSALARTNAGGDDYNHITTAFHQRETELLPRDREIVSTTY
ncbi:hypothetical protein DPMN_078834 [Dreissena polymorpha]|uniref:Uncharacterized protein n=1 Tax=Dreissena polymorpha TaxID=45954 RepID=A0A9D4BQL7_DREPO|nr:hypothetical protein DPMN_078834 [Dreissena polymorpha]